MTSGHGWWDETHPAYDLPGELEQGAYAEQCVSWHTPYAIVLEFLAPVDPSRPREGEHERVPSVMARVRLPVGAAFEMIRNVSDTMGRYERQFGEIQRPQRREPGGSA